MPAGRIFYLAPDDNRPVGGIRVIYRHVEILHQNGFNAAVLHMQPGFRPTWFDHNVPIGYLSSTLISRGTAGEPGDIVVFPDIAAHEVLTRLPGVRKVILNQGYFLTFSGERFDANPAESPYRHRDLIAVIVNSAAAVEFMTHALPGVPLHHTRVSIDPVLFHFQEKKRRQIAFMSRRNPQDLLAILNILKHRHIAGGNTGVDFALIENVSLAQSAAILRDSLFFLGVGPQEGFAMPPAEAMATGAIVVGYHGFGGREYLTSERAFPIEPGDVMAVARTLEQVIQQYQQDPAPLDALRARAARFIGENYAPAREEQDVLAAWRKILGP